MKNNQVFLRDTGVAKKIVDSAEIESEDVVLEIGSGDGRLTGLLAEMAGKVYAVEKDIYLLDEAKMKLDGMKNIVFINADILVTNIPEDTTKIVANLPYDISSPVTEIVVSFMNKKRGTSAVLMYQKEFGERMMSVPGFRDYSMLSVFCQYTCYIEKIMNVSKNCFKPRPKVDSIVLKLRPKDVEIDRSFLKLAKLLFQHKKKSLYSAMMDIRENLNASSKDELRERLSALGEDRLKRKVFYFDVQELINIYEDVVRLSIWTGKNPGKEKTR